MKVGIFTFPNSISYGAALQMFALYHTLKMLGYDTEVINYYNISMKKEHHVVPSQTQGFWKRIIRRKLRHLLHIRMYQKFRKFESQMMKYPRKHFSDPEMLTDIGRRYDAVICGSDQVWNPDITGNDLSYFLDFCGPNTARISYAPSFGVEELEKSYGEAVGENLRKFSSLSVREEAGERLVYQVSGRETQLVVDPTLLLDRKEWERFEKPYPTVSDEYILYYTIKSSDTLWNFCKELAQKHNLKILCIGSNIIKKHFQQKDNIEYVCDVSPEEWLYLMHHARCIVTNSFHGTAFSINYRKDFYVEFSSMTNSRLKQIVEMFGLEKQVVKKGATEMTVLTDYSKTEQVLPVIKGKSETFLKEALESIREI